MTRRAYTNAWQFFDEVARDLDPNDGPMMSEAWNDFTDGLQRDGYMTALELSYCPAHGDEIPDDAREHVLDRMRVRASVEIDPTHRSVPGGYWAEIRHGTHRARWRLPARTTWAEDVTGGDSIEVLGAFLQCLEVTEGGRPDDPAERNAYNIAKGVERRLRVLFSADHLRDLRTMWEDY